VTHFLKIRFAVENYSRYDIYGCSEFSSDLDRYNVDRKSEVIYKSLNRVTWMAERYNILIVY